MDPQRTRIQEDLRGLIAGDVRCDDVFVQLYACDASIYEIKPLGVVLPRGTEDLVACVKYAAENNLPLHARGAGSGIAGQCLGPGLVIDFSRHFRRILHTGPDTVRVQPGVVHERLNQHLRQFGRQFNRRIRFCARRNNYRIRAAPCGQGLASGPRVVLGAGRGVGARSVRRFAGRRIDVKPQHATAGGFQHLHGELPD